MEEMGWECEIELDLPDGRLAFSNACCRRLPPGDRGRCLSGIEFREELRVSEVDMGSRSCLDRGRDVMTES